MLQALSTAVGRYIKKKGIPSQLSGKGTKSKAEKLMAEKGKDIATTDANGTKTKDAKKSKPASKAKAKDDSSDDNTSAPAPPTLTRSSSKGGLLAEATDIEPSDIELRSSDLLAACRLQVRGSLTLSQLDRRVVPSRGLSCLVVDHDVIR